MKMPVSQAAAKYLLKKRAAYEAEAKINAARFYTTADGGLSLDGLAFVERQVLAMLTGTLKFYAEPNKP